MPTKIAVFSVLQNSEVWHTVGLSDRSHLRLVDNDVGIFMPNFIVLDCKVGHFWDTECLLTNYLQFPWNHQHALQVVIVFTSCRVQNSVTCLSACVQLAVFHGITRPAKPFHR